MNGVEILSLERIAEIKAFKNTDFSDCPIMTEEELKKLHAEAQRRKVVVR
jgi:hypothetical protein